MAALILEAASEPASLAEIVARVAEAAGIARPGEELAGKVRAKSKDIADEAIASRFCAGRRRRWRGCRRLRMIVSAMPSEDSRRS
jgi:hypothetical protein